MRCVSFFVVALLLVVCAFHGTGADQAVDLILCEDLCNYPAAMCIDPMTRHLYVADTGNHRVLRFGPVEGLTNRSEPEVAFGQSNLSATDSNMGDPHDRASASSLSWPSGVFVDASGSLWVADRSNHRVLRWDNASTRTSSGAPADGVLGQSNFTNGSPVAYFAPNNMVSPRGLWVDEAGTLWVADSGDSRILRYSDPASKPAGAPADGVLGHSDLLQFGAGYSAGRLSYPSAVQPVPGGGVIVADLGNNRVLYFSEASARTNGGDASYVFGQQDLHSPYSHPVSDRTTAGPRGVAVAGSYLLVSTSEDRVLMFENGIHPSANNVAAVGVLGQPDFDSSEGGESDTQLLLPSGLFYDEPTNSLWVADANNHRIVRFPFIVLESQDQAGLKLKVAYQGRSPNVHLLPLDHSGSTYPQEKELFMVLSSLEELDPSGAVVARLPIPLAGYSADISAEGEGVQTFNFHRDRPPFLDFSYSLLRDRQTMSTAGLLYTTDPSALKLTLNLGAWPFADPANTLTLHLRLHPYPALTSIEQQDGGNNKTSIVMQAASVQMTAILNLLPACIADGAAAPVAFNVSSIASDDGTLGVSLRFPSFTTSLQYEPNLSVTLPQYQTDNDDDDGDQDLYPLLALLALLPVAGVLIAGAVVAGVAIARSRARRSLAGAEVTGGHDQHYML